VTTQEATAGKPPEPPQPPKTEGEKKENVENLRKIIKIETPKTTAEDQKKPEWQPAKEPPRKEQSALQKSDPAATLSEKAPGSPDASREDLEQRRTILQNLKDFDFQIKKNQEDITHVTEKIDSLSKDLDDLVSLYEIVSEQMNPFVGLSKVTKKRLDALENITTEVDTMKNKVKDMETIFEKGGHILPAIPQTTKKTEKKEEQPATPASDPKATPQTTPTAPQPTPDLKVPPQTSPAAPQPISPYPSTPPVAPILPSLMTITAPTVQTLPTSLSDAELDIILSKALESLIIEQQIDSIMNDFFQDIK